MTEPSRADILALLAPHVDAVFYRARNPDVAASGADPVAHYAATGWREGRDPSPWFDSDAYLDANPDIRAAGLNPLLHYLRTGRLEGRAVFRPDGGRRRMLDALERPQAITWVDAAPAGASRLEAHEIAAALRPALAAVRGFVLALSHDDYTRVSGGVQAVIADEQRKYRGARHCYLHLAPVRAGPALAETGCDLLLTLDGATLGTAPVVAIVAALRASALPLARSLVVHALMGHAPEDVAALAACLAADRRVFWAHDYFAACEGYTLLRNDLAYCGAPPADSMACRICRHGDRRPRHVARLRALFDAIGFEVAAPSQVALDLWRRAAALPVRQARVQPHCRIVAGTPIVPPPERALRVAFVGLPVAHKGWPLFLSLVQANAGRDDVAFHHVADAAALRPQAGLTGIAASVRPDQPDAMVRAVRTAGIDIVLVLSPWPETFSLVTHEALAAGADVLALAASGNAATVVQASARGAVLADGAALLRLFEGGRLPVRSARATGALLWSGTTATLGAAPAPAQIQAPDLAFLFDDGPAEASLRDGLHRLAVPPGSREMRILSRATAPADVTPHSTDRRRLGIAVARLALDGTALAAHDPRLLAGWHRDALLWTDGDARLCVEGAREVSLVVSASAIHWRVVGSGP